MICDRLVVGIWDNNPSQQLQMDVPKLTLVKAKTRIHQEEAIHHQQGILKGNTDAHIAGDLKEIKQTKTTYINVLVVLSLTRMTVHLVLKEVYALW